MPGMPGMAIVYIMRLGSDARVAHRSMPRGTDPQSPCGKVTRTPCHSAASMNDAVPPMRDAICRTIARPRPVPDTDRLASPRLKASSKRQGLAKAWPRLYR
jgi:hypothetical protein